MGGGFLIVPALVLLGGLPMHQAVATSLVIIAMKSYSGFCKYLDVRAQQSSSVDWQVLAIVTSVGVAGSVIGRRLRNRIPQQKLRQIFSWFLVLEAVIILVQSTPQIVPDQ